MIRTKTLGRILARCLCPNIGSLLLLAAALGAASGNAAQTGLGTGETVTVKAEFFVRGSYMPNGVAAALHSLAFGDDGCMYVGSLGDTNNDVTRIGKKKIYRITPDGKASVFAEIECQYITTLAFRDHELHELYACLLTSGLASLVKFASDKSVVVVAAGFGEAGDIIFKGDNIYLCADALLKIRPDGQIDRITERSGAVDHDISHFYSASYGSAGVILRDSIENDKIVETREIIVEHLPFYKGMLIDPRSGRSFIRYFDNDEYLLIIDGDGRRTNILIKTGYFVLDRHQINKMALGKGEFGDDYLYMTTWMGDILRVNLAGKN